MLGEGEGQSHRKDIGKDLSKGHVSHDAEQSSQYQGGQRRIYQQQQEILHGLAMHAGGIPDAKCEMPVSKKRKDSRGYLAGKIGDHRATRSSRDQCLKRPEVETVGDNLDEQIAQQRQRSIFFSTSTWCNASQRLQGETAHSIARSSLEAKSGTSCRKLRPPEVKYLR